MPVSVTPKCNDSCFHTAASGISWFNAPIRRAVFFYLRCVVDALIIEPNHWGRCFRETSKNISTDQCQCEHTVSCQRQTKLPPYEYNIILTHIGTEGDRSGIHWRCSEIGRSHQRRERRTMIDDTYISSQLWFADQRKYCDWLNEWGVKNAEQGLVFLLDDSNLFCNSKRHGSTYCTSWTL